MDTQLPLVSVIIPTHNRVNLLKRAIQSVLDQSYRNLEIIIVDDVSKDNIRKVVDEFNDSRIRYIRHDSNRGGSAARNTGIRAASGEYVAFLDDDDEWAPQKTEEQLKLLNQYDAVVCSYSMDSDRGKSVASFPKAEIVDLNELRCGFRLGGSASALMARMDVLKDIRFDESLPKCQDWDLYIQIAHKYRIGYLDKPLFRYDDGSHQRISNRVLSMTAPQLENELRFFKKHEKFFGKKWFRRHMCKSLLYGIKNRENRFSYLGYVINAYGLNNVVGFFARRLYQEVTGKTLV